MPELVLSSLAPPLWGDVRLLRDYFRKNYPEIYAFAYALVEDDSVAGDIAVSTFMKFLTNSASYESEANADAFLHITTRNNSFMYRQLREKHGTGKDNYTPAQRRLLNALKAATLLPKDDTDAGLEEYVEVAQSTEMLEIFRTMFHLERDLLAIAELRETYHPKEIDEGFKQVSGLLKFLLQGCAS